MEWQVCLNCGSAQLANPMPLELIYQGGHATGLGSAWDRHHQAFAAFVADHRCGDVLEAGGGGGKLARFFRHREPDPHWYILEPNPTLSGEPIPGVEVIRGFFDPNVLFPQRVETLVFCHCLEHIYDIGRTIEVIAHKLPKDGRVAIAWPDIRNWLAKGEPGAINYEHTFYCPVDVLLETFERNGLSLVEQRTFGDDHSIFLALKNTGTRRMGAVSSERATETRAYVKHFFATFEKKARVLNGIAEATSQPLYAAPASIYTQYLFAFGLDHSRFRGLLDNSPLKQGHRLYGTPLQVLSPSTIRDAASTVFLNGGAHTAEMTDAFKALNAETQIVSVADIR
jgi:hypothetical protein